MKWSYHYLVNILIVAAVTAALIVLRKAIFRFFHGAANKNEIKDLLLDGVEGPSTFLIIALALYVSIRLYEPPEAYLVYALKGVHLSLILTVTMGLANVSGRAFAFFLRKAELPISVTGLLNAVIKAVVYGVGFLVMLNFVGISVTPIITALGVGGLAMALALQDTLSNLFAGIHILAEHTIRVGDYIRIETGQEGFVVDIGWRTARIRTPQNNLVIMPNSKLSQSVVTNYHLPDRTIAVPMTFGVSYDTDPETVERILIDEALKATAEVPGLLNDPKPHVRFLPGLGPSSLDFTLLCFVRDYADQQPVQHALNKRILKRFTQEGIEVPFPTRTVYLRNSTPDRPHS